VQRHRIVAVVADVRVGAALEQQSNYRRVLDAEVQRYTPAGGSG
jgi:hypothetical protein